MDFSDFFVAANGFLDPADDFGFGQVCVRDQVVGALKTDAAVGATGVGAVVGIHGVVSSEHEAVVGFALKSVDAPGEGGGHD